MYKKLTAIRNKNGLHARPASDFVRCASRFKSDITIRRPGDDTLINAKSIIIVLAAGMAQGEAVELSAEGEDEQTAVDTLAALLESCSG